jgi:hypothetical protein
MGIRFAQCAIVSLNGNRTSFGPVLSHARYDHRMIQMHDDIPKASKGGLTIPDFNITLFTPPWKKFSVFVASHDSTSHLKSFSDWALLTLQEQTQVSTSNMEITNVYTSKLSRTTHVYVQQQFRGIPIVNSVANVNLDRYASLEIVFSSHDIFYFCIATFQNEIISLAIRKYPIHPCCHK